jgi:hypothetical protein
MVKHPINFYTSIPSISIPSMKLMSKKQSMLNPSKTNYHKEGTGNADYQHWVLLEEVKE